MMAYCRPPMASREDTLLLVCSRAWLGLVSILWRDSDDFGPRLSVCNSKSANYGGLLPITFNSV